MKIRFTKDIELEVVVEVKNDEPTIETETFLKDTIIEIDICDDMQPPFAHEIQFGDGSVAFVTEDFWKNVDIEIKTL